MNAETVPAPSVPADEQPTLVMPNNQPPNNNEGNRTPTTQEELERGLNIHVVDTSQGVVAGATDYANAELAEKTSQRGFKGFLKKIWYGSVARDYFKIRKNQEGRAQIMEAGNIHTLQEGSQADHNLSMAAIVTRFTDDYLHSGERQDKLADVDGGERLENGLKVLVNYYGAGAIDEAELVEQKTRLLDEYKQQLHAKDRNKGLMLADNVLEVAQTARAAVNHGIAMERIQEALTAHAGEARVGQRTEAGRELADKIVDKIYGSKVGSNLNERALEKSGRYSAWVNETTLGVASAVALSVAKLTTRKAVTAAAAAGTMGAGAGIVAGAREYAQMGRERQQHMRERAVGMAAPAEGAKRREQLEETRYETIAANDLHDQLTQARQAVAEADPDSIRDAVRAISEVQARIDLSDRTNIDLIDFSSNVNLESERLKLDIALAEAKVAARRALGEASDESLNGIEVPRDLDEAVGNGVAAIQDLLQEDVSARDAVFKKLRLKRTGKMALAGFVTGETFGLALQEVRAVFSDSLQGVFESGGNHVDRRTLLAGLLGHGTANHLHGLHNHDPRLGKNGAVDLPQGYHIKDVGNDHWELLGKDNHVLAHDLTVNQHGAFTHDSQEALERAGFKLHETTQDFTTRHVVHEHVTRSPEEFLHRHPGDFTKVNRQLWYDNNTPYSDLNELKLWWGGTNDAGIDAHGDFVFNVANMTPGGSFHDGLSANAQQLIHEGKMAIALSMTHDTQSHVIMIPIDEHGNAVIKANSWVAHNLFTKENGQAQFTGAYAEAVQLMGKQHGVETMRMLATVVGADKVHSINEVLSHVATGYHERVITHLTHIAGERHIPVEIPPVIPVYARRGLESETVPEDEVRRSPSYYGYGELSEELLDRWRDNMSPRLRDNPDAVLDPSEELSWYRKRVEEQRGAEYLQDLDRNIDNDEVLANIDDSVDAIVTIPVAAASESENIYNTLSLYAQQSDDAKRRTVILMNVNWRQSAESDPESKAAIDKTIAEIERAKADFPDLKIASFQKQWTDDFIRERNGVIGEVVKVLYDVASMSMERSIREGRRSNREALIIRNDADEVGLRKNYIDQYLKAMTEYPDSDAYSGIIRFDTRRHKDFPSFGIITNFARVLNIRRPVTSGANSAFRMSSLAAVGGSEDSPDIGAGADDVLMGRKLRFARGEAGGGGSTYGSRSPGLVSSASSTGTASTRVVIRHILAAQVDTNGDRFLGVYRRGGLFESSWEDFSEGGYRDRREELKGLPDNDREDPVNDINIIAGRIEKELAFYGTGYNDPGLMSWALGTYFGTQDRDGNPLYTARWNNGEFQFRFTDSGRQWLQTRLTRDERGRFDPYGSRVRRRLYREKPSRSNRPTPPGVRFVAPLSS